MTLQQRTDHVNYVNVLQVSYKKMSITKVLYLLILDHNFSFMVGEGH